MKKNLLLVSSTIFLLVFSGCTASVKMKVFKPAEVDLGARKRLAILNFDLSGNMHDIDGNYTNSAYNINFSDKLISKLFTSGIYTIVERDQLSRIMAEQALGASGFLDPNTTAKLGKILGVEAIITGSIMYSTNDQKRIEEDQYKFNDGVLINYTKGKLTRESEANLSYRVIDTQTGQIIDTKQLYSSDDSSTQEVPLKGYKTSLVRPKTTPASSNPYVNNDPYNNPFNTNTDPFKKPDSSNTAKPVVYPNSYYYNQMTFYNLDSLKYSLSNEFDLVNDNLENLSEKIAYQLTPHYEDQVRVVKGGNASIMNDAVNQVNRGDWAQAKSIWENVLRDPSLTSDYATAIYNLGVYYEVKEEFDTAIFYYDQAYQKTNNNEYLTAKGRVTERKKELKKLYDQGHISTPPPNKIVYAPESIDNVNHFDLANTYYSQGKYDQAVTEYQKELTKNPNNSNAYTYLGAIYYLKQDLEKAIYYYNKAIKLDPNDATKHYNLALVYKVNGKVAEYNYELKRACSLGFSQACNQN